MALLALAAAAALATVVDGEAALRHERALGALGPHPWGSPRAAFAAQYVASQFREAGLHEVRIEEFEVGGRAGRNVVGVLRAPGTAFVLVAAHHDSADAARGSHGGGAGVLIELAHALAQDPARPPRTIVFAAFDGGAADPRAAAGAREWLRRQATDVRFLTAALVIESAGEPGGTPILHPLSYADPLRPGHTVAAPGWLVASAVSGSAAAGMPFVVHGPLLGALQQPLARALRLEREGGDRAFLGAGLPAVLVSDGPPSISWRADGATLAAVAPAADPAALARTGQAVLGATRALATLSPGLGPEPDWFLAFGQPVGRLPLLGLVAAAATLFVWSGRRAGAWVLATRALVGVGAIALAWRHPVPTAFAMAPWLLLLARGPRPWNVALGALPALAAAGLAAGAWFQGAVLGSWLQALDWGLAGAATLLALVPLPGRGGGRRGGARRAAPAGGSRKGR